MKKKYIPPQSRTVILPSPVMMLGGSNTVNGYINENDDNIVIGDSDT